MPSKKKPKVSKVVKPKVVKVVKPKIAKVEYEHYWNGHRWVNRVKPE